MSISVKNISIAIDGISSKRFCIDFEGDKWMLDDFTLYQSLLHPNTLSFTMHKVPEENANETMFSICGQIIGKPIDLSLETDSIEQMSLNTASDVVADINFSGVITSASGSRNRTEYIITVQASSWEDLLNDNPNCKSYEDKTLNEIIHDVVSDFRDHLEVSINPQFTDRIPYCVQYNETDYQFIQRLAKRYGEWLYNNGNTLVFGQLLNKGEHIQLVYPSQDIPTYNVNVKIRHVNFTHIASSYNSNEYTVKDGTGELTYGDSLLGENVLSASQECYKKQTLQNLHSGGFSSSDGRASILQVSTSAQIHGEQADMLTYSGCTYCSKLKIGNTLTIIDNYIVDNNTNKKSKRNQDEILVTELVHNFGADETYSNHFEGIPISCEYPAYSDSDIYPIAQSCRAKVVENEDPNNLGRVRVQFDWQALQDNSMTTPWLRMVQPYAGGGKGFSFIPEIGEEVMVDFEGGNAERPYIKGTLYNGIGNPDTKWISNNNSNNQVKAIRTRNGHTIEIHDEGNNGYIRIYDDQKENYVLTFSTDERLIRLESKGNIELDAQNDVNIHAGKDINIWAGNDILLSATHDMQRNADNDIREYAGNDRDTHIVNCDHLLVDKNQFVEINDSKDEKIKQDLQIFAETIRAEATDKLLEYSKTHHQKANESMSLNAGNTINIKAEKTNVN